MRRIKSEKDVSADITPSVEQTISVGLGSDPQKATLIPVANADEGSSILGLSISH